MGHVVYWSVLSTCILSLILIIDTNNVEDLTIMKLRILFLLYVQYSFDDIFDYVFFNR